MIYLNLTCSVCLFGKVIKTFKGNYEIFTIEKECYLFCVLLRTVIGAELFSL